MWLILLIAFSTIGFLWMCDSYIRAGHVECQTCTKDSSHCGGKECPLNIEKYKI
jgi:hypothetical protein